MARGPRHATRRAHYLLRLIAGVGGAGIAALTGAEAIDSAGPVVHWVTFAVGLLIAIALFIDGFLNLGDRWRHYRLAAEALKGEGWRFVQLAEPYAGSTHAEALSSFVSNVEAIIGSEVVEYVGGPARPAAGG